MIYRPVSRSCQSFKHTCQWSGALFSLLGVSLTLFSLIYMYTLSQATCLELSASQNIAVTLNQHTAMCRALILSPQS